MVTNSKGSSLRLPAILHRSGHICSSRKSYSVSNKLYFYYKTKKQIKKSFFIDQIIHSRKWRFQYNPCQQKGIEDKLFEESWIWLVSFTCNLGISKNTMAVQNMFFAAFSVSMGGTTSLFVGASLLSFVELVYYFTIRVYGTYYMNKKKQLPK